MGLRGTRRNWHEINQAGRSARRRRTSAFRFPSREFNPCPAYERWRFLSGRITRGHTKDAAIVPPAREQLGIVK
jgi:hypothetical protein